MWQNWVGDAVPRATNLAEVGLPRGGFGEWRYRRMAEQRSRTHSATLVWPGRAPSRRSTAPSPPAALPNTSTSVTLFSLSAERAAATALIHLRGNCISVSGKFILKNELQTPVMLKLFWKEGRGRKKNITNILTLYLARLHDSWQHYLFLQ